MRSSQRCGGESMLLERGRCEEGEGREQSVDFAACSWNEKKSRERSGTLGKRRVAKGVCTLGRLEVRM